MYYLRRRKLYAAEFFGFHIFAFYYSQHVPVVVTNPVPTQPVKSGVA